MRTLSIKDPPQPPLPTKEKDRRRSDRTPKVLDAWICSPTATDPAEEREVVTAVNLSRHGVAFALEHSVPTGAFYIIEFSMGGQKVVSEVRIISCRKAEDGRFEVGAEFF